MELLITTEPLNEPDQGVRSTPGVISGNAPLREPGSTLLNIYDVNGTLDSNGTLCTDSGGGWDASISTCTPRANINWVVFGTSTIDSGITLAIGTLNSGVTVVSVIGTLVNKGSVDISKNGILSTSLEYDSAGMTQYGTIDNSGTVYIYGSMINNGAITNSGMLDNFGYFGNRGSISNTA